MTAPHASAGVDTKTNRWQRLFGRARDAWQLGGPASLLRLAVALARIQLFKCRAALWHLRSVARRIRAASASRRRTPAVSPLAFNLLQYNPIGWRPHVRPVAAALGPIDLLPSGAKANLMLRGRNVRRLRGVHHLADVQAFHHSDEARARELIRLAAAGVVVHLVDAPSQLQPLLGDELYALMTTDPTDLDLDARELQSVRMRRSALRDHASRFCAWREGEAGERCAGDERLPLVSILLASKRPGFLSWAIANVAKQTYPRLELVLALHGDGFVDVPERINALRHPVKVLHLPASESLGGVLNAATETSSGALVTKMDDDDLYGADHLWDLVLAREYSQAHLVGKWLEFVYLAKRQITTRRFSDHGERYQASGPAGGTMLLSRHDLHRFGGWPDVKRGVDTALANNILRAGGAIYRTHALGFILVRHGDGHTWDNADATDTAFLATADRVWPGFQPHRAGIEAPPMEHPAPFVVAT